MKTHTSTTDQLLDYSSIHELKGYGIIEVMVTYEDHSTKLFFLEEWVEFRKGVIINLHDKGLVEIDFIRV